MLITRRRIPLDRTEDYARLWHNLRRLVENAGARAWLFRAHDVADHFIEFVEWQSDETHLLSERQDIAEALATLAAAFLPRESGTWIETKI